MVKIIKIYFFVTFVFTFPCCLVWAEGNLANWELQAESEVGYKKTQQLKDNIATAGRSYKFPSIMIERDMVSKVVEGKEKDGIILTLCVKRWRIINDKYGRQCKYVSPETTYGELQSTLNFNDEDVTVNNDRKTDEPHAYIKTQWLTLNINYLDKVYDGKDKSVRLKAIVINNEEQAGADAQAEYDKKKGVLRTILDFFETSPH